MSDDGSISCWIDLLKEGDCHAAQVLWEKYYVRLIGLARKKLGGFPRRMADEDDVVASAFHSFYDRAQNGRFPKLSDRDDLWRILVTITARKAVNQIQYERRAKRGGRMVQREPSAGESEGWGLAQVAGTEPTPEFAAQFLEVFEGIINELDDPALRVIVLWKLEGRTNSEISKHLDCSLSAVERKLRLIRKRMPNSEMTE